MGLGDPACAQETGALLQEVDRGIPGGHQKAGTVRMFFQEQLIPPLFNLFIRT